MDFRLSVLKAMDGERRVSSSQRSVPCIMFREIYLFFIALSIERVRS